VAFRIIYTLTLPAAGLYVALSSKGGHRVCLDEPSSAWVEVCG
jgi:hypothetical protein